MIVIIVLIIVIIAPGQRCQRRLGRSVAVLVGVRERRLKSLRVLIVQGMAGNLSNPKLGHPTGEISVR